jgi:GTP-binding protein
MDMLDPAERARRSKDIVRRLRWKGPVFEISALARQGLDPLLHATYEHVAATRVPAATRTEERFEDEDNGV